MKKKKGRFSRFLNPTLIIVDLLIIIIIISVVSSAGPFLLILLSFSWIVISTFTRFYHERVKNLATSQTLAMAAKARELRAS